MISGKYDEDNLSGRMQHSASIVEVCFSPVLILPDYNLYFDYRMNHRKATASLKSRRLMSTPGGSSPFFFSYSYFISLSGEPWDALKEFIECVFLCQVPCNWGSALLHLDTVLPMITFQNTMMMISYKIPNIYLSIYIHICVLLYYFTPCFSLINSVFIIGIISLENIEFKVFLQNKRGSFFIL